MDSITPSPTLSQTMIVSLLTGTTTSNWTNIDVNNNNNNTNDSDATIMTIETDSPTVAPISSSSTDSYTPDASESDLQLIRFSVYLIITFLILGIILLLNHRDNKRIVEAAAAAAANNNGTNNNGGTTAPPNNRTATTQDTLDHVKQMTPEERQEYVNNFLKKQKFVDDEDHTIGSIGSNSFRLTKSSTRTLEIEDDDDNYNNNGDNKNINSGNDLDNIMVDLESGMMSSSNIINNPKKKSRKKRKEYSYCAICLDRFVHDEDICVSQDAQCIHVFHLECLYPWLLKSQDCPCCRRDFLSVKSPTTADVSKSTTMTTTAN